MAIKIVVSDTVGFKVKGTINDAAGTAQPFDFTLTCERLDADAIQDKLSSNADASTADFMASVVSGWSGVKDADDKPMPYNPAALRQLFKIPGVASVTMRAYLSEVGAKEKN